MKDAPPACGFRWGERGKMHLCALDPSHVAACTAHVCGPCGEPFDVTEEGRFPTYVCPAG